jgi:hypothetical protein
MLNAFIDAHKRRHVATVDIKGAFLKAKVREEMELIVKMSGEHCRSCVRLTLH